MEALAGWLFRRYRRRYTLVIVVTSLAFLAPGVLVPTVAQLPRFDAQMARTG